MFGRALAVPVALTLLLAGCSAPQDDADSQPTPTGGDSASSSASSSSPSTSSSPSSTPSSNSSSSSPAPRPAKTFDITIQGGDFVDGSLTIQKGDTVRWTQQDANRHTVTADDGSFASGDLLPLPSQDTFSHVFDTVGSFPYHCAYHGGMTDAITVVETLPA